MRTRVMDERGGEMEGGKRREAERKEWREGGREGGKEGKREEEKEDGPALSFSSSFSSLTTVSLSAEYPISRLSNASIFLSPPQTPYR